jgi:hypothetical protein
MVHVSGCANPAMHTTGSYYLNADTMAFMQFILSDLFKDFPKLRLIIPHGGGAVPFHWGRFRGLALNNNRPELTEIIRDNIFFDTCVYHQPGIDLLFKVVPVDNILFASEMVGAVRGNDPKTGFGFDDTKRYVEGTTLSAADKAEGVRGQRAQSLSAAEQDVLMRAALARGCCCSCRARPRRRRSRSRSKAGARDAQRHRLLPLRQPVCAAGSVVSYKQQPHRTALTLAEFENHHRGLADQNKGQGRIRDVRIKDVKERSVEGVRGDAGRPRGRLGRQHHDLHDRVAPDRAGPELQPGERLTQARMDLEQLRGLPAPDGQYRRIRGR